MIVKRHTEVSLEALTAHLPASSIVKRLQAMEPSADSMAIEVCRMPIAIGSPTSSNGDSVVVIVRAGVAITAMLRRSWNQPLTPSALRVDVVESWDRQITAEGKAA